VEIPIGGETFPTPGSIWSMDAAFSATPYLIMVQNLRTLLTNILPINQVKALGAR
jgi:hypothetical protein